MKKIFQTIKPNEILVIPLLFFVTILIIANFHSTFEEWDGVIQYFQGIEIFHGEGYNNWGSHYWPPLYSILIGLLSNFTSGFFAAKFISILASTFTLIVVFYLVTEFTGERKIAIISQLLIALNPYYLISSIQAENHMLDTLFFVSAFFFLVKFIKDPDKKANIVLLACSTAFATLSRYTSYSLIPLILIVLIFYTKKKYFLSSFIIFTLLLLFINLPWYYYNYIKNGFPLHTWQYLNIGSYTYPGGIREWQWSGQTNYQNISQILNDYPRAYFTNFIGNAIDGCINILRATKIIIIISLLLIFSQRKNVDFHYPSQFIKNKYIQLFSIGFIGFLILVSQAFVFTQVFLSWNVLFTVFLIVVTINLIDLNGIKKLHLEILLILLIINLGYSGVHINKYLKDENDDDGELADYKNVNTVLCKEKNIADSYIMAIHPARAYYANSHYIMLPEYFKGNVAQLVKYEGLSEKVKTTQPKYLNIENKNIHSDFLIYDIYSKTMLPQFEFLFDEKSSKIPENFQLLFKGKDVVVYKID